ncbi:hypothetical protein QYW57_000826 [Escherichia coli]|nr:hypothetical protein [Escherichia coli]EIT7808883.1 hypothetical protein [Escherichia coli]EMA1950625.1 hypothetical protein [Escherichia coli]EMA2001143.1 hypothetical protein [Escherichia coli]HEA6946454.1 hypothetical protein [Escherichia coli]
MKQMSLIEMDGFLKGKCIPRDLKVNETNAEYLVRKFAEAEAKCAALAAENARLKSAHPQPFGPEMMKAIDAYEKYQDEVPETGMLNAFFILRDSIRVDTPATDAFLAEVRAQGVEMLAKNHQSIVNALKGDSLFSDGEYRHAIIASAATSFAAELRKGGNQ